MAAKLSPTEELEAGSINPAKGAFREVPLSTRVFSPKNSRQSFVGVCMRSAVLQAVIAKAIVAIAIAAAAAAPT
jgi:hypothetical protein